MNRHFSETMASLRRARGLSQRTAAADLGISQAQLSHYENGVREPGLDFLCRACDYYGVTADYLLGREERSEIEERRADELRQLNGEIQSLAARMQRLCGDAPD